MKTSKFDQLFNEVTKNIKKNTVVKEDVEMTPTLPNVAQVDPKYWPEQIQVDTEDLFDEISDTITEIQGGARGSYTGAHTEAQLASYLHELADRLHEAADAISNN